MTDLAALLNSSGLLVAEEAAQALNDGWRLTDFAPANVADLTRIYSARAEHLATKAGPHAQQLRASTKEFVANLRDATGATLGFIQGPAEHQYVIAMSESPSRVIGCLKIVSKLDVSERRWEELWSSAV
jgi:hypothetical protein